MLVFHHIPKTAGMALRVVVMANARENYVDLDLELAKSRPDLAEADRPTLRREALDFFRSRYGPDLPVRENCHMAGHVAPLFLPAVSDRSVRAFCLLRDPVDRVLSLFFHFQRHGHQPLPAPMPQVQLTRIVDPLTEVTWTLKDVYQASSSPVGESLPPMSLFADLFNGQVRHLLMGAIDPSEIPLEPDDPELDRYKQQVDRLLADRYLVGTQDRFSQSVRLFGDSFGWRARFVPHINASPDRNLRDRVDGETIELIRAHNRLDADLYAEYSERLSQMPSTSRLSNTRWKAQLQAAYGYRRGLRRPLRRFRRRLRARIRLRTRVAATVRRLRGRPPQG